MTFNYPLCDEWAWSDNLICFQKYPRNDTFSITDQTSIYPRHTKFKTFLADNIFLAAENFNMEAKWLYAELLFLFYIY